MELFSFYSCNYRIQFRPTLKKRENNVELTELLLALRPYEYRLGLYNF